MESLDTLELTLKLTPKNPWSEILVAELAEHGFDGFVTTDDGLQAYGNASIDAESIVKELSVSTSEEVKCEWSAKIIPHQNWNEQWEKDFHPVFVEEYATILAPFHDESLGKGMVVRIQPQMSFGTGHHQTTWMMTKALFELENMPNDVLDMGTGTGVLAVIAEKLGATRILAIDIEEWSAENARENAQLNECKHIECVWGDRDKIDGHEFGLIIANINKNILKAQMETYAQALKKNGRLLLSGFFSTDVDELVTFANAFGLTLEKQFAKDEWAGLQMIKN
ncbi:MAG: 50S ribosomal protein L11 methyltransferase [Flavobacteriales bacterium]|nr:50S ribosomal protein L11 methyltransferase [Flavobacteriales bacterium]